MVVLSLKDRKNKMNPAYVPDDMEVSSPSLSNLPHIASAFPLSTLCLSNMYYRLIDGIRCINYL